MRFPLPYPSPVAEQRAALLSLVHPDADGLQLLCLGRPGADICMLGAKLLRMHTPILRKHRVMRPFRMTSFASQAAAPSAP